MGQVDADRLGSGGREHVGRDRTWPMVNECSVGVGVVETVYAEQTGDEQLLDRLVGDPDLVYALRSSPDRTMAPSASLRCSFIRGHSVSARHPPL